MGLGWGPDSEAHFLGGPSHAHRGTSAPRRPSLVRPSARDGAGAGLGRAAALIGRGGAARGADWTGASHLLSASSRNAAGAEALRCDARRSLAWRLSADASQELAGRAGRAGGLPLMAGRPEGGGLAVGSDGEGGVVETAPPARRRA